LASLADLVMGFNGWVSWGRAAQALLQRKNYNLTIGVHTPFP
jgi:hypothetical protein